jgi:hypothetical protein
MVNLLKRAQYSQEDEDESFGTGLRCFVNLCRRTFLSWPDADLSFANSGKLISSI